MSSAELLKLQQEEFRQQSEDAIAKYRPQIEKTNAETIKIGQELYK